MISCSLSVYQKRRRFSAAPRPTLTKGQLPSRLPPFVSVPGRLCLLRRVSLCSPPYPSYRVQLASCSYEGFASFSRPTAVFLPGRLCLLRRAFLYSPPHPSYRNQLAPPPYEGSASFSRPTIRILARQALPLTKGFPLFPTSPFVPRPASSLSLRRVSFLSASHSRIRARQGFQMPRQKEKAGHFARPPPQILFYHSHTQRLS